MPERQSSQIMTDALCGNTSSRRFRCSNREHALYVKAMRYIATCKVGRLTAMITSGHRWRPNQRRIGSFFIIPSGHS
jgi:hypothetical protein